MERETERGNFLQQLEKLREKMVETALVYGINHPKVLWYSQQIDEKHNRILQEELQRN